MLNKKRSLGFFGLFFTLFLVVSLPSAHAGVGIFYEQQYAKAEEGGQTCLTYKLYNPFDEESVVSASVSGELEEVLTSIDSEEKTVPANTPAANAVPIELCFEVPEVYQSNDCLGQAEREYTGYVLVRESPKSGGIGSGSTSAAAVSAPLTLKVECIPGGGSGGAVLIYSILAIVLGIIIVALLIAKFRKTNYNSGVVSGNSVRKGARTTRMKGNK